MAVFGRSALSRVFDFVVRGWFRTEIPRAMEAVSSAYAARSELTANVAVAEGIGLAAGALTLDVGAIDAVLAGRIMAQSAADTNVDYLVAAATVGTPIFEDGADASALSLATNETAYCTLIVTNSDNAGGVADTDGGAMRAVVVIAGTAATYAAATAHLSSASIQSAVAASTEHAGVTGWAHVAQILFDENGGAPTTTIVANVNNRVNA